MLGITALTDATAQDAAVELVRFRPAAGVIGAGEPARSELAVRNAGSLTREIWFGYSVRDPAGIWFDVPAVRGTIAPGATASRALEWIVPPNARGGGYRAVMALWTGEPGQLGSIRLLAVDREAAFVVRGRSQLLMEQPNLPWRVASHPLGRGTMLPTRVFADGAGFRLVLSPNRCDGAEMRSAEPVGFGTYTARMRAPDAPGSLSAFFLYGDGSGDNDEIDIEIFNDDSRRALLTSWIRGRKAREAEIRLPFDPRAGLHDYTIHWTRSALEFRADGQRLARWTRDYPLARMRIVANLWWPAWLECVPLPAERELVIESIRLVPDQPAPPPR